MIPGKDNKAGHHSLYTMGRGETVLGTSGYALLHYRQWPPVQWLDKQEPAVLALLQLLLAPCIAWLHDGMPQDRDT